MPYPLHRKLMRASLSLYGKTPTEVETICAKWQPWLEQVLGVEAPSRV